MSQLIIDGLLNLFQRSDIDGPWNTIKKTQTEKETKEEKKNTLIVIKPKIGKKIKYFYNNKFYKGEIIDKNETTITIKLWNSVLNPKVLTIDYPINWNDLTRKKLIVARPKNKIFPTWVNFSELCIISGSFAKLHSSRFICKITDYIDGKNITLFHIKYPQTPYDTKKLKTTTIDLSNQKYISTKSPYINFKDKNGKYKVLYPYLSQIEIESDYDKINDISNRKLLKKLWKDSLNKHSLKSTHQQIIAKAAKVNNECSYVTTSKLQYGIILECKSFPFDINRLIISFLAQKMIYICPPTPCNKIQTVAQTWQFSERKTLNINYCKGTGNKYDYDYELSVVGVEFQMNKTLTISGFELNNIEMLGRYKHKIYLNGIEATQLQLFQQLRNAQFIFNENKLVTLKRGTVYNIKIKVNANVPCYQCHEPPSNIKGFIKNHNNMLCQWKCFTYIKWRKFNIREKYTTCKLEWFPHFAFLLP